MTQNKKDMVTRNLLYFEINPNMLCLCLQYSTLKIQQFEHKYNKRAYKLGA
jgi:hypothetical protein